MEYICRSSQKLDNNIVDIKSNGKVILTYIAKLNNIYVVESDSIDLVRNIGLFEVIKPSRRFSLAKTIPDNVMFTPHISKDKLRVTQSVGWGMNVGVLDSGVKAEHCSMLINEDSKDFTGYGNQIIYNHSTYVAKIINYYAPGARIFSMKIAHTGDDIIEGNIIKALDYSIDKNMDILNLSFENEYKEECLGDCSLCDYINAVVDEGIVVVTVSGNYGELDGNTIGCPGRAERAITVGAVNRESRLSDSSGKGVPGFLKPNILAPGSVSILMGREYEHDSGTSYAAPIITGILTSLIPTHGKDEIISKMYDTCTDLGYSKYEQGFGLLNIDKLLEVREDEQTVLSSS